jgi:serine/threonine protein phosphatase PrpC
LTDLVSEDRIARVLQSGGKPQQLCDKLIEDALNEGGRDNVTVVVAHYTIPSRKGHSGRSGSAS